MGNTRTRIVRFASSARGVGSFTRYGGENTAGEML